MDIPADLQAALNDDHTARIVFEGLPPSHQREYVEWIEEARSSATRQRRIGRAIERLRDDH